VVVGVFRADTLFQVSITVNDKESEEVAMLLGSAGEAYFLGETHFGTQ